MICPRHRCGLAYPFIGLLTASNSGKLSPRLWLFYAWPFFLTNYYFLMETAYINKEFTSELSFEEVAKTFFKDNSTESVQVLFWKFFQCWVTRDCNIISDMTDEDVALFFDQLIDLVAAAHILHEANRVSENQKPGGDNE